MIRYGLNWQYSEIYKHWNNQYVCLKYKNEWCNKYGINNVKYAVFMTYANIGKPKKEVEE